MLLLHLKYVGYRYSASLLVLGQYWCSSSFPVLVLKPRFTRFHGAGSGTLVLVPSSRYHGSSTRFSGGNLHFSHFGFSAVKFWLQIRLNLNSVGTGTLVVWNLKCSKFAVSKCRRCGTFGIFCFSQTRIGKLVRNPCFDHWYYQNTCIF